MELERTGPLKRTTTVKSAQVKTEPGPAQRSSPLQRTSRADKLTLSQQAVTYLEEQNQKMQEEARRKEEQQYGSDSDKAALNLLKAMKKCEQIAARIMAGDKVPPEDERYLMENDSDGYKLAIAMRKPKKDPKEWESVLEEEDKKSGDSASSEGAEESGAVSGSDSGAESGTVSAAAGAAEG